MRFWNIKESINELQLAEANEGLQIQHAVHDIQTISKAMSEIPAEKNQEKLDLYDRISKLNDIVKNFVSKAKGEAPTDTTVEAKANPNVQQKLYSVKELEKADAKAQADLEELAKNIKMLEAIPMDEKQKQDVLSNFTKNLDNLTKDFETLRAQRDSARSERDEAINFVKEVTGVLVTLGNKVQGYQDDVDTSSMTSRDRASYKKMSVNAEKFTKTLKQALFGKILDMQEGSDVTQDEIKGFLQACVDGKVINMLKVISTPSGNIKDHVNPEYKKVFDVFVQENIFSYSPGTTSGAIGPGEMALSMMGNPAEKGKKGDLKIGDEEIEIKASAKTGGRFNSKSIAKATTGWQVWSSEINKIMQKAPEDARISVTQKDNTQKQVPARKYNGNQFNVIKGRAKEGSKYNWNASGFKALNIEVLEPYADKADTYNLFEKTIQALVQNYDSLSKKQSGNSHHKPFNPGDLIADAINDDGTADMVKMNLAYSKIAYSSYHLADGITTVMLLRTDTLDYTIFKDADDLITQMKGGNVITGGGFNWNDDQQTPTPGYNSKSR